LVSAAPIIGSSRVGGLEGVLVVAIDFRAV
jgi:hypothetical protein